MLLWIGKFRTVILRKCKEKYANDKKLGTVLPETKTSISSRLRPESSTE